jgi:hypothetical protein
VGADDLGRRLCKAGYEAMLDALGEALFEVAASHRPVPS